MPLTREQIALYGPDWPRISREARERAGWKCDFCGARNGEPIHAELQQSLPLDDHAVRRRGALRNRVVLTVAHLDQNPTNHRPANLAALCQACHLQHDKLDNLAKRARSQCNPAQTTIAL